MKILPAVRILYLHIWPRALLIVDAVFWLIATLDLERPHLFSRLRFWTVRLAV